MELMLKGHPKLKECIKTSIYVYVEQITKMEATLKVHKMENFFDSDFGTCVISFLVMSKY